MNWHRKPAVVSNHFMSFIPPPPPTVTSKLSRDFKLALFTGRDVTRADHRVPLAIL
jgi:hypothetical protein